MIVEPYDVIDDVDGFPEKSITRKPQEYIKSREVCAACQLITFFTNRLIYQFFSGWSTIC